MIATRNSRKSLRLLAEEEDSLLAGMDFQTYYLGRKEILMNGVDLDSVVEEVYSQYVSNTELNSATQLAITVDAHQLQFRNVITHNTEFIIALTNVKSVYTANKKTKFPNAVIIVSCLPPRTTATAHVMHCFNPRQAREFYNAISRAFDYFQRENPSTTELGHATELIKANKDLESNGVSSYRVNTAKSSRYQGNKTSTPVVSRNKSEQVSENENMGLLQALQSTGNHDEVFMSATGTDTTRVSRSKAKTKSTSQIKDAEGIGLLENIDPDEAFDDEFTNLARNRSLSDNFRSRFGR